MENLFSYGSLRDEAVQLAVFGRTLNSTPDAITGYRLRTVRISNWDAAAISGGDVQRTLEPGEGEPIEGMRLHITEEELKRADRYEPAEYKRIKVRLRSGTDAWVYVRA